jgi:hypothetical protein
MDVKSWPLDCNAKGANALAEKRQLNWQAGWI